METDGITFFGDVFLPRPYKAHLPWLGQYVFNLEYAITQATAGIPGKVNLKASDNYSSETFGHLPVAVSVANNHILDYEHQGLDDTLRLLHENGIQYFGAGNIGENCNNPAFVTHGEYRIALLGYVCASTSPNYAQDDKPGVAPINAENIARDIASARNQGAHRVIVSVHWGVEQIHLPKPDDVVLAHAIIDAGADMLIGHHAHCMQEWELYKDKYIFYGLGNCIFPDIDVPAFYQGETPTKTYTIKNHSWNKKSIAIEYFPDDSSVKIRLLAFDGEMVGFVKEVKNTNGVSFIADDQYKKRFHRAFIMGKIKLAIFRYLNNPRLPSLNHFRTLINIASNKVYK